MPWVNIDKTLKLNAKKYPKKIAVKDKNRALTYAELDNRANRLANGLLKLGLKKGDKIAVLLYNSVEFIESYLAVAKAGLIAVPINYRYIGKEIEYVVKDSESKGVIVGEEFVETVNSVRSNFKKIKKNNFISVSKTKLRGYVNYEELIADSPDTEPKIEVSNKDTWILLYTSGTTGKPKGVVRSHESYISFFLINAVEFRFSEEDTGLIIMPLYHVNSTFYGFVFIYIGATLYVHQPKKFDPVEFLEIIDRERITFTSLIPTHLNLILELPENVRTKYDLTSLQRLLCSSAPAHSETKKEIMEAFPNVQLYEAYGSTEAGLVTILKPKDQYRKIGSIGQECVGTDMIRLLDEKGKEVAVGEVGELYSKGPMMFDKYYKMPAKTKKSFKGEWFSAGDLAKKDGEGYYYLVDRKDNMIITGGEHVYPSEVENVIARHPKVFDAAVIGIPDKKWGECIKAIVILKEHERCEAEEIIQFCVGKIAGYKKPKSVDFIKKDEMPRTPTGKILHRVLRTRYCQQK